MTENPTAHNAVFLLQLDPSDNAGVLPQSVKEGDYVQFGDQRIDLSLPLGLGHKIALANIAQGEKILKYGCAIGSATQDIQLGEHIHLHNMKSDYLPTHTLEKGQRYGD